MNKDFKPYIPAGKVISEMTLTSIILGLLLAVIFGAANAYLGLRVGMTVSASIPAAVISMTIIRIIMKRDSILENNMVQTIGSAGESLAAGAIFTMPALFLCRMDWFYRPLYRTDYCNLQNSCKELRSTAGCSEIELGYLHPGTVLGFELLKPGKDSGLAVCLLKLWFCPALHQKKVIRHLGRKIVIVAQVAFL